jgi:hypothetical protein
MAAATNQQVQVFVNNVVRQRCNDIRDLFLKIQEDKAHFDDIYANVSDGGTTFADAGLAGGGQVPPHFATPGDVLAWNTFITALIAFYGGTAVAQDSINAAGQYPIIRKLCTT